MNERPSGQKPAVALYIASLAGGGAEMMTVRLANQLAAMGIVTDIVVNEDGGPLRHLVSPAVGFVSLEASRTIAALPRLVRYLHRADPDVLITGLLFNSLNALLAKFGTFWRGRLVLCQHNTFSSEARIDRRHAVASTLFAQGLRWADGVVAVSEGVKQDLVRHAHADPAKVRVVYNPIIHADFEAEARRDPGHPWLAEGADAVFVTVGRLTAQKDIPTLLKALAILRRHESARLLVLGEGALLDDLKRLAGDLGIAGAVDFLGFQANPLPFIARSRALVLTSTFEGFGNVLAEAMGCGTPVISTACNGPVEVLGEGAFGTLVPIGDAEAVAVAMAAVLRAQPNQAMLREAASRFRCDTIARQYMDVALGRAA